MLLLLGVKGGCRFRPMVSSPTSFQLDQIRPQPDRVTYRDYTSFFYPPRYKITGREKIRKVGGKLEIDSL